MSFHPLTIVTPTWKTFQKIHLTSTQSVLSLRRIKWSTFGHQVDNTARFWGSYHSLSLQINENRGFNIPLNAPFLGKYTFVSFLPWSVAVRRSVREYWAGSKIGTNPNSYIAFFFYNNSPLQTHSYHKKCLWKSGLTISLNIIRVFFSTTSEFFEMRMGGCGGYFVSK